MIRKNEHGLLIVVSGPSGCGKSTLNQLLLKKRKNIVMSISDTTRAIRGQEVDGVDYNFITPEQFKENIKNDKYLEYAMVYTDKYYGTPVDFVDKKLKEGIDVILEIDIEGARKVNEKRKDAVFIFIMPPSMKVLKDRLVARKTETKEQVIERFKTAYKEINEVSKYNYVIVNDNLDEALAKMDAIITCEKCRVDRIEEVEIGNQEEIIHEILMDFEKEKDN
ncbi:MAG: guanylate kinase [Bacilli bacterium]|nr:guanylate kinase [Bacilli bacterium]